MLNQNAVSRSPPTKVGASLSSGMRGQRESRLIFGLVLIGIGAGIMAVGLSVAVTAFVRV